MIGLRNRYMPISSIEETPVFKLSTLKYFYISRLMYNIKYNLVRSKNYNYNFVMFYFRGRFLVRSKNINYN